MQQHLTEHPASALAHGPAKTSDIEHLRDDLGRAEQQAARVLHETASRYERHAAAHHAHRDEVVAARKRAK